MAGYYAVLAVLLLHTTKAFVGVQINTRYSAKFSILNCKPVQEYSYCCLAIPNIYTITRFISLYDNIGETWEKRPQSNQIIMSRISLSTALKV